MSVKVLSPSNLLEWIGVFEFHVLFLRRIQNLDRALELESSRLWTKQHTHKVRIFRKYFYFTPMNDTTVRLLMYLQVVEKGDWSAFVLRQTVLLPFGATSDPK